MRKQSAMIGCVEKVALIKQFIQSDKTELAIEKYGKSKNGEYLDIVQSQYDL